jgi:hypothetical protein
MGWHFALWKLDRTCHLHRRKRVRVAPDAQLAIEVAAPAFDAVAVHDHAIVPPPRGDSDSVCAWWCVQVTVLVYEYIYSTVCHVKCLSVPGVWVYLQLLVSSPQPNNKFSEH